MDLVRVPAEPFSSFSARLIEAAGARDTDLVFFSQVFFNSGFVVRDFEAIVNAAAPSAMVVIDGYHGFFAVPTSLRKVADRAFFTAGGYKYAQSGEGVCFLSVPRGYEGRPLNTGWFAGFGALEGGDFHRVAFSNDGFRFMGATFDPVGLYRFNAVARLFDSSGLTIAMVDDGMTFQRALVISTRATIAELENGWRDYLVHGSGARWRVLLPRRRSPLPRSTWCGWASWA